MHAVLHSHLLVVEGGVLIGFFRLSNSAVNVLSQSHRVCFRHDQPRVLTYNRWQGLPTDRGQTNGVVENLPDSGSANQPVANLGDLHCDETVWRHLLHPVPLPFQDSAQLSWHDSVNDDVMVRMVVVEAAYDLQ